jgi:hypothetical protein
MGRTIAIIDFAHCGTTMLAGVLELLGVPMVVDADFDQMRGEDPEIIRTLQTDEEAFRAEVEKRNAKYESWGFKWPGRREYWPLFQECLREPVFLTIWKDPVSVTRRRFGKSNARLLGKLRNTARQMQSAIDTAYKLQMPMTMFSYCKAVQTPGAFIKTVAGLAGVEWTWDQVARIGQYIQPNVAGPRAPYASMREYHDRYNG